MTGRLETMGTVDRLLGPLNCLVLELDHDAAIDADKMVVVLMAVGVLVLHAAGGRAGLAGQAGLHEEAHRPEDRGLAHPGIRLAHGLKNLLGRDVTLEPQKGREHYRA